MPVPPFIQPPPPNRVIRTYTRGTGSTLDPAKSGISSVATSPNQGILQDTGPRITPMGIDQNSKPVQIPALTAGQQYVATVTIPLPQLPGYTNSAPPAGAGPTPRASLGSRQSDRVIFSAGMTVQNPIADLHVVRFTAVPRALCGGQTFNGPNLPPGQSYSSFFVFCTVTFSAEGNTSAGTVVISTNGNLTLQSGGGT